MKKILSFVLAFTLSCLVFLSFITPIPSSCDEQSVSTNENCFDPQDMVYLPFIYSSQNTWMNENVIKTHDLIEGKLYTKNFLTGEITLCFPESVFNLSYTMNGVAFVTKQAVLYMEFETNQLSNICSNTNCLDIKIDESNNIWLLDGLLISCYNLSGEALWNYTPRESAYKFCIVNNQNILYFCQTSDAAYLVNPATNTETELTDYNQIATTIVSRNLTQSELESYMSSDTLANFSAFFDDYVVGSSFSATYHGASHCYAYALMAADTYSHRYVEVNGVKQYNSNWTLVSGDETDLRSTFPEFGSGTGMINLKTFLMSLPVGSQVRVALDDHDHMHSFLLVKAKGVFFVVMEENVNGSLVSACEYTYDAFSTLYPCLARYDRHHFSSNGISVSSTHHRRDCTSSGCGGYILEAHSYVEVNGVQYCRICGAQSYFNLYE